jgi:hypothetical protein
MVEVDEGSVRGVKRYAILCLLYYVSKMHWIYIAMIYVILWYSTTVVGCTLATHT